MLDILDKYKVNPQILEHLQRQANYVAINNIFDPKLEGKRRSMNKDKGLCVQQHRREYYNDFEDCLRDYKNAKIKSIQKQTKVHLSDGDNGESDSDYVDCTDSAELKHQSTHKSMPHVPSGNYQDNSSSSSFCQQLDQKAVTAKRNESEAHKAQLNTNYAVPPAKNETSAQLTSPHKNNHNRIIDTSCNRKGSRSVAAKVSSGEKSISIDDDNITTTRIPSTSNNDDGEDIKHHVNQNAADKQSKSNEAIRPTPVQTKRDEQTKRRSCKKKLLPEVVAVVVSDPTQR